jgi:hypothetical protein
MSADKERLGPWKPKLFPYILYPVDSLFMARGSSAKTRFFPISELFTRQLCQMPTSGHSRHLDSNTLLDYNTHQNPFPAALDYQYLSEFRYCLDWHLNYVSISFNFQHIPRVEIIPDIKLPPWKTGGTQLCLHHYSLMIQEHLPLRVSRL